MTKRIYWGAGCVALAVLFLALPIVHALLAIANFAVHFVVLGLQVIATRLPRINARRRTVLDAEPFVSIHVPAHNEPPDLLKRTLLSLSKLRWSNYEVLVIDNNTTDSELWKPVEEYCRELGPRFRFFHIENLDGAKAGAMNWVRQFMDERAEFVFVIDADYVVERNAIRRALSYWTDPKIGLVQFPQEYRNIGPGNTGLALEFKHFFAGYMNMAQQLDCVPSTGTLSFFSVEALRAVGGFDTSVVTEDAEIAFRLNVAGYRSVYANEVIGRGLIPHDLESLKKQRWRWAFGNAQILKLNWRRLLFGRELRLRQKVGYLVHLTAWFNFNLIPSLSLILLAIAALGGWMHHPLQPFIVVLSGLTLTTFAVLKFGTVFYSLRHEDHSLREITLAFLTHLGLGWIFSASWIKCLFDHRAPFVRTNKFLSKTIPGVFRSTFVETTLGVALFAACAVLIVADFIVGPVAAVLMATARFLIYWVRHQIQHTFRVTTRLAAEQTAGWRTAKVEERLAQSLPELDTASKQELSHAA